MFQKYGANIIEIQAGFVIE